MPDPAMRGVVSISVDADASSSPSTAARDDVLSVVIELLDRFHTHRIAATWAFHDPAGTSLAARRITSDMPGQEVALQVAASDSQGDLSRGEVLRTIVRRLQSAAAAGVSITSLAATGDWNARNIDLLTKQGISIIRAQALATGPASAGARQGIAKLDGDGAHAVCHGLWHVPVSISLHGGGWIANRIQLVRLAHRLNRAAARGGLCHVRIDAAAMAAGDVPHTLRTMDRFLRHLDRLCHERRINIETLRGTAERLLPKRSAAAQSILRAA
jgi:hypothetical protein